MHIPFDDIEHAFMFVSMDQKYMNSAFLCKESGEIFYRSELVESDELPEDIDDVDKYIAIPHKIDLDLGRNLVMEFATSYLPHDMRKVREIFSRSGAYARFKDLLEHKGLLKEWHQFEDQKIKQALKEWCKENSINIDAYL
ncbi:MAG: UPF0158 family protein [Thermodesulfobacteriota bacterium]